MSLREAAQLFGISTLEGQSASSLKKIYHHLANQYHPDKGGSAKEFIQLRQAYTTLKEALRKHTPFNEAGTQQAEEPHTQKTYSSSARQSPNFEVIWEKYNDLQTDYQELYKTHQRHDQTFNIQIQIINKTVQKINNATDKYNHDYDTLKATLKQNLEYLDKQHDRTWWEHIVSVPKLSENEYVEHHNLHIESYNKGVERLNEKYNETITQTYQHAFETFVELIKNL